MLHNTVRLGGWALALCGAALSLDAAYLPVKAEVAQMLLTSALKEGLEAGEPVRPWSWADMEVVGRIAHPALGEEDVILRGGAGQAMAFGPAMITAPDANVDVFAAHRDTHFDWLKEVKIGDRLALDLVGRGRGDYEVMGTQILRWDQFTLPQSSGRRLIALATCYPFDSDEQGPLRYIVWARAVD